ncbi:Glutamate-rich WD repeat-containing protein 1, partial [Stegodyphus mimosarum]
MLVTGDCKSRIHLWKHLEGGTWHVDQRPYIGHTASVEDLEWSPIDVNVIASCSVDKTIRIWDIRAPSNKSCMLTQHNAHDSDVNVISWDKTGNFILSGGDDGKLRVWDLRMFPEGDPICTFKYHTAPITSVEWHPTDHSVFAASGADDQLTQWDLAVERDDIQEEEKELSPEILALPPQLLFIHQGQKEIKELHWHKQMPGVLISTALSGFDVFR